MTFPQCAVSKWIGYSITISGRHYVNDVPDELFNLAAATADGKVQQNAQQKAHEMDRNASKEATAVNPTGDYKSLTCKALREFSSHSYPRPY